MSSVNIILVQQVKKLGKIGDIVTVKSGYAKNFLIPFGKAKFATKAICNDISQKLVELEEKNILLIEEANNNKANIEQKEIEIECAASQGSQLFGSIKAKDISALIKQNLGIEINKDCIELEQPIKAIGNYEIKINLHPEVSTTIILKVTYSQANA